jgi:hypothetical protein
MKILYFTFLLLAVSNLASAQGPLPDCPSFHTGEYLYTDSTGDTWELRRKKKIQTERNTRNGKTIKFKILWLSDCEYRLTQTWTNIRTRRKWNRAHFSYRIIRTTPNSYTYDCSCKDSPAIAGTVVRVMN